MGSYFFSNPYYVFRNGRPHCHIRNKNCDVGIVINPASLNEKTLHKIIGCQPNSITISFSSIQKEVFERLCPTISFEDALKRTLELVNLSRGNTGLRMAGIRTEINSVGPEEYVNFWKKRDVRADVTACHGRSGNLWNPDIYVPKTFGLESGRCGLFQFHTFITWEAEVLACCHDLTGDTRIGNLINDNVSVIAKKKQNILKSSMPFSVCQRCDEPLRRYIPTQCSPPKNRNERRKFFRSISRDDLSLGQSDRLPSVY